MSNSANVEDDRIMSPSGHTSLNVCRGFGDREFKLREKGELRPAGIRKSEKLDSLVVAEPDYQAIDLSSYFGGSSSADALQVASQGSLFVLLASDGIWNARFPDSDYDNINEAVGDFVYSSLVDPKGLESTDELDTDDEADLVVREDEIEGGKNSKSRVKKEKQEIKKQRAMMRMLGMPIPDDDEDDEEEDNSQSNESELEEVNEELKRREAYKVSTYHTYSKVNYLL